MERRLAACPALRQAYNTFMKDYESLGHMSPVSVGQPEPEQASPGRGRKVMKDYIAVFVCLATKATHIEVVSDYSTPAFLAAFRRFVSRRGLCLHMYSDNGTTFQGADAELSRLFEETSAVGQQAASSLASEGVSWHFTPPYVPNFGGLWESIVKAWKHHLKRVIGEALLTYEELATLMSQIEACLNSRPLGYLSSNDEDPVTLTPGHFLIEAALISPPDPTELDSKTCLSSRWKHLQQRTKWTRAQPNLQVGEVVLIKNELQPATKWLMGRIVRTFPVEDGLCRVAMVRTAKSEIRRPVSMLVPLTASPTTSLPAN
ncbi:uncharacterized protein LOC106636439 [Copidosoma floridanum]|uniref:uncharacterized protein LOC106636439 n=1 Tax=Copidosoma floridanum TaxID=29053 RepID=UPI0006C9818D|nr:uncharacterized protein LOC106636439 [Copidosoma floridanum]